MESRMVRKRAFLEQLARFLSYDVAGKTAAMRPYPRLAEDWRLLLERAPVTSGDTFEEAHERLEDLLG